LANSSPHSTSNIGRLYGVDGKRLSRQYRGQLSNFQSWDQRSHAKEWLLYPQNLGTQVSIDETSLSHEELYTILTNKAAKGKKGSIIAIVAGTQADRVIEVLCKIPENQRKKVKEITLDTAGSMKQIAKRCFPRATRVTD
jgi:transposase